VEADRSLFFLEFLEAFLDWELELVRDRRSFCRVVFDLIAAQNDSNLLLKIAFSVFLYNKGCDAAFWSLANISASCSYCYVCKNNLI
jgi:hypothetical protein